MFTAILSRLLSRTNNPKIALLTDFGDSDHYVGTMKGVISSINPKAITIDISHNVPRHSIRSGAYLLWASYKYFPPKTLFLTIVDPGVGTERDILIYQTGRYTFLAPGNGLLDLVMADEPNGELRRFLFESWKSDRLSGSVSGPISRTFHGRDILAPVAAQLSLGSKIDPWSLPCAVPDRLLSFYLGRKGSRAEILHCDSFGNLTTNIKIGQGIAHGTRMAVKVGRATVRRWIETYDEGETRKASFIEGSSGLLEIVVKNGSASDLLKSKSGDSIGVTLL
jgi:hypothetical protein